MDKANKLAYHTTRIQEELIMKKWEQPDVIALDVNETAYGAPSETNPDREVYTFEDGELVKKTYYGISGGITPTNA